MSEPEDKKPEAAQAEATTPEAPAVPEVPLISIDHFAAVQLKTGEVVAAEPHPNADRLVVMKVDVGEEVPRQIVAGIRSDWEPEALVGRRMIICCNLKPAKLRGVESQGMMLAVRGEDRVWPLTVEGEVKNGTRIT